MFMDRFKLIAMAVTVLAVAGGWDALAADSSAGNPDTERRDSEAHDSQRAAEAGQRAKELHKQQIREQFHQDAQQLDDPSISGSHRRALIRGLRRSGQPAEEVVPVLIKQLRDDDPFVVIEAMTELDQYGPAASSAVPHLQALLRQHEQEPAIHAAAARALGAIAPGDPAVVQGFVDKLSRSLADDPRTPCDVDLIRPLGAMGPAAEAALPVLMECVQREPRAGSRWNTEAYRTIGRIAGGPPKTIEELQSFTPDKPMLLDGEGYAWLMGIQQAGRDAAFTIPALLAALETDPPRHIQTMIIETLGEIGIARVDVLDAILAAMLARDWHRSEAADEAFVKLGPGDEAAARRLGEILLERHDRRHRPSTAPPISLLAARAMYNFGPQAAPALDSLIQFLQNADGGVSIVELDHHLRAIAAIGPQAQAATPVLLDMLDLHSPLYRERRDEFMIDSLRAFLLLTLIEIGTPDEAMPHILDGLTNTHPSSVHLLAASARAAGSMGPRAAQAVPHLMEIVRPGSGVASINFVNLDRTLFPRKEPLDEISSVHLEAVRALERIGPVAADAIPVLESYIEEGRDPARHTGLHPSIKEAARRAIDAIEAQ